MYVATTSHHPPTFTCLAFWFVMRKLLGCSIVSVLT